MFNKRSFYAAAAATATAAPIPRAPFACFRDHWECLSKVFAQLGLDIQSGALATMCCYPSCAVVTTVAYPRHMRLESHQGVYKWEDLPLPLFGAREALCKIVLVETNWN